MQKRLLCEESRFPMTQSDVTSEYNLLQLPLFRLGRNQALENHQHNRKYLLEIHKVSNPSGGELA
jgi:hypothetical protein